MTTTTELTPARERGAPGRRAPAGARARAARIVPTGREIRFGEDELIVSKTDPKGIIRYANDVFLRVSRYAEEDVLGQPHSFIRHPAMPRGIFRLLWQTIASGREIFAYINNLASDGDHYWVLAHVTPSFGPGGKITGYHSNRRLPDPAAVAQVEERYARMTALESRYPRAAEAAAASQASFESELADRGLSYEQFVWQLVSSARVGG